LTVVQKTEDDAEVLENHRLAVILDSPSPDYDMGELQALTEAYRLIYGAALWLKQRESERGEVMRYIPFSGDQFRTEAADGRIYGRFIIQTTRGELRVEPEDVVHFRDTNPNSWRTNLSKLDVALSTLDQGHQVNLTIRNFLRNAMFPGGVISPHQDWNPDEDEFQAYTNRVKAYHAGPGNSGEPLILTGGTTFSGTSLSLKDLLPGELLDRIEATTASVLGIPPVVLGWLVGLKNSPWSQMSEARRMTYEDTIEPRWGDIEKKMTRQLLTPQERAAGQFIRFDTRQVTALQTNDEERAKIAAGLRQEWTLNERRIYTGQEPLDDERGDEIDTAGGAGLFDLGGEPGEMGRTRPPALKVATDPKGLHWLLFDTNCKAAESTWEREIFKALQAQQTEILKLARKYLKEEKAVDENSADLFTSKVDEFLTDSLPAFLKLVFPLVFSTGEGGVRQVSAKLGLSFSVLEESLQSYSEREAAFLSSVMGETTGKDVAAAVQKGILEGETVTDLTKRLKELPAFDRARAKLTARTETTRAWNGAQRTTLSDYQASTGVMVEKSWLSSRDGVPPTRQDHADQDDGKWIPIDAVFTLIGLTEPGEQNCRCTLLYRIAPNSISPPEG
jgi:HK97 family phage portal protein